MDFSSAVGYCAERQKNSDGMCAALIPYEREAEMSLKAALGNLKSRRPPGLADACAVQPAAAPEIHVFIGPEGGYSPSEIALAMKAGIVPVTLGARILRTETAGLAAIFCIMYEFEFE
jgi:16S rRNA (uracil1498-N3)-methyltransferase